MKEKYNLFENSDDWLYEDPVPSVETWNIPKEMVVQLSPVFCSSVRDTLREESIREANLKLINSQHS